MRARHSGLRGGLGGDSVASSTAVLSTSICRPATAGMPNFVCTISPCARTHTYYPLGHLTWYWSCNATAFGGIIMDVSEKFIDLLCDAQAALHTARGLGLDGQMRGAAPPADRATPSVKQCQLHPSLLAHLHTNGSLRKILGMGYRPVVHNKPTCNNSSAVRQDGMVGIQRRPWSTSTRSSCDLYRAQAAARRPASLPESL